MIFISENNKLFIHHKWCITQWDTVQNFPKNVQNGFHKKKFMETEKSRLKKNWVGDFSDGSVGER